MKKLVNGELVDLTSEEIAEREAEQQSVLQKQIADRPNQLRKQFEFKPVTVNLPNVGDVIITPFDDTLTRLYAVYVSGQGVTGWRADNGVFNLTNAQVLTLFQAGQASVAKAFEAQAAIEGGDYETIQDVENAFMMEYNGDG